MYLSLHNAYVELGEEEKARAAIKRGVPRLVHRLEALGGPRYERGFLLQLAHNAAFLAVADRYNLLPDSILEALRAADEEAIRPTLV